MLASLIYVLAHALCVNIIYLNNTGKRLKAVNDELKQYLFCSEIFLGQEVDNKS